MKKTEKKNRRYGTDLVRHARHLRNMRGDLFTPSDRRALDEAEENLVSALNDASSGNTLVETLNSNLAEVIQRLSPTVRFTWIRENVEIAIVALAVAMAFRSYFLQPFKIPTGSMQETLFGVHGVTMERPGFMDRIPMKFVKWIVTGEWYKSVVIKKDGWLEGVVTGEGASMPGMADIRVGSDIYTLPSNVEIVRELAGKSHSGRIFFRKGTLLWSGTVRAGDHVFVDKIRWNFVRPQRAQVVVFRTDGIPLLPSGIHYIKRLVGIPGDMISITPPYLNVNGNPATEPAIDKVARKSGYQIPFGMTEVQRSLGHNQYFMLGDNTGASRDSRYWGTVPAENLVGPALIVYWPFSSRWGLIR